VWLSARRERSTLQSARHFRHGVVLHIRPEVINYLTLCLLILSSATISRAQFIVTGKIFSKDDKDSLPGVNVVEKGTKNGTVTDMEGHFTLDVSDFNATLVFSFIGMVTEEVPLKGQSVINFKMKSDCHKDFFDSREIYIYGSSGIINTPIGGQINVASPWLPFGLIKGQLNYQTNLNQNELINAQAELSHSISDCGYDFDFKWNYRSISFNNDISSVANSVETYINFRRFSIVAGYSQINFDRIETTTNLNESGVLIGFGTYFGWPLRSSIVAKISIYKDLLEYQTILEGNYKKLIYFVKYYKVDSFNELSLGLGVRFGYGIKRHE